MSCLMMALLRRNMQERLTKRHNKVVILMYLLVFYEEMCNRLKLPCVISDVSFRI
jgi:hypothetical protein